METPKGVMGARIKMDGSAANGQWTSRGICDDPRPRSNVDTYILQFLTDRPPAPPPHPSVQSPVVPAESATHTHTHAGAHHGAAAPPRSLPPPSSSAVDDAFGAVSGNRHPCQKRTAPPKAIPLPFGRHSASQPRRRGPAATAFTLAVCLVAGGRASSRHHQSSPNEPPRRLDRLSLMSLWLGRDLTLMHGSTDLDCLLHSYRPLLDLPARSRML
ncbi:hypothetical protein PCL_02635 [Purpureocillium lilacinum]|uniref:Uncharacterized protein n=1 Tax=Purpureocillium lilacinum TaxID=33203 RepID=A0A2U3DZP4_PURLI|nr:hypothetical protein PCL_02635 [Purpureocillium lilacinum]